MIKVQRKPLIGCLQRWIKVFSITIDHWTNQLIMGQVCAGRVGYVPSLLCAELVMCRVGYAPSLLCAEFAMCRVVLQSNTGMAIENWERLQNLSAT